MSDVIYLDAQGTERPRPEAVEMIHRCLTTDFGNPSATAHRTGQRSLSILESARATVASVLNASADGIVFCSGATEANNTALRSFVRDGTKLIASAIEHKSVLEPGALIASSSDTIKFETCTVGEGGTVDLDDLAGRLGDGPALVSVMHANNEVGTIQPIAEIAALCRARGALLHVDAAQTVGKLPVDFTGLGVDMMTISGHKFGGPVGSGALIMRPDLIDHLDPLIVGGGQESGLRGGTVPVAMIAGMAAGLEAAHRDLMSDHSRIQRLRDILVDGLSDLPGFFINGDHDARLTCNFSGGFLGIDAALIMRSIPDVHFSAGSACTTGTAASHVLTAMGVSRDHQKSTMRISLSWMTTEDDIMALIEKLRRCVAARERRLVA
ncbi:MAG: cysteine desulfurase family protein [Pseudomonadota bacterium]